MIYERNSTTKQCKTLYASRAVFVRGSEIGVPVVGQSNFAPGLPLPRLGPKAYYAGNVCKLYGKWWILELRKLKHFVFASIEKINGYSGVKIDPSTVLYIMQEATSFCIGIKPRLSRQIQLGVHASTLICSDKSLQLRLSKSRPPAYNHHNRIALFSNKLHKRLLQFTVKISTNWISNTSSCAVSYTHLTLPTILRV